MSDYEVYDNLVKLVGYRGAALTGRKMTKEEFTQDMNNYEYVVLKGLRKGSDIRGAAVLVIIMTAVGSKYAAKSADFGNVLVKSMAGLKEDIVCDLLVVTAAPLKHLLKKLASFVAGVNEKKEKVRAESHTYDKFCIEAPRHVSVPEHIIMAKDEIDAVVDRLCISENKLPIILDTDTQAVWIGLRPGMCVKIMRLSETAGVSVAYRYCMKG